MYFSDQVYKINTSQMQHSQVTEWKIVAYDVLLLKPVTDKSFSPMYSEK